MAKSKHTSAFDIINQLKEHATYLENIAQAPISPEFSWKLERSARVMRRAAHIMTFDETEIPAFLRKQA